MTTIPTPSTKLAEVTKAIVEAVPEFELFTSTCCGGCQWGCNQETPITLEDVLRALQTTSFPASLELSLVFFGWLTFTLDGFNVGFRLDLPLHLQSEALISFLFKILCPQK